MTRAGEAIILQPREFRLLEYLMKHAGQVVTRTMLLEMSGTIISTRRPMSSTFTFPGFGPRSTRISATRSFIRSAAPAIASVTALTKLFRTTTFRLSLTYLALFSAAAILAIAYIYWNTTVLLWRQLNQTIDAEVVRQVGVWEIEHTPPPEADFVGLTMKSVHVTAAPI